MSSRFLTLRIIFIHLGTLIIQPSFGAIDGVSLDVGSGVPDDLWGAQASVFWNWNHYWFADKDWNLSGYWNLSAGYWDTDGDEHGDHQGIGIVSFAPVLRYQKSQPYSIGIMPYIEGSIGAAGMTSKTLATNDLGSYFAFQDMVGAGFRFGDGGVYDISYQFIHYSNLDFASDNDGITIYANIKFTYHFS